MTKTRKIALCAALSAAAVAVLAISSAAVLPVLTGAAAASLFIVAAVTELGRPYPIIAYAAVSAAGLLLLPDKLSASVFAGLFGHYVIFKGYIEKYRPLAAWPVKISYFNIFLMAYILAAALILESPPEFIAFKLPVFAAGNVLFILYDLAMSRLILYYIVKIRPRIRKQGK